MPLLRTPLGPEQEFVWTRTSQSTFCEWVGSASYYTVRVGDKAAVNAVWFCPGPNSEFSALRDDVAFYPSRMDTCFVDGEQVQAQPGDFYGGWTTHEIASPFKGDPGTEHC